MGVSSIRLNEADIARQWDQLQRLLDDAVFSRPDACILEAGCGSGSNIKIPKHVRVVGIDISPAELAKNTIISERIVGDIQTYALPRDRFDLIVCWDVLEHLEQPQLAMQSFIRAVKPEGYVLLAFPNVHSLKSVVAKLTPHWFHEHVYRRIYGSRYGRPGIQTFPTYLRWKIAPDRVRRFAREGGLIPELEFLYESGVQRRFRAKYVLTEWRLWILVTIVRLLSCGAITVIESDCLFLFRRSSAPRA